ncbi:MAG: hypothetical protein GY940_16945 [bacterium]|nr:hypothetical protein [bacterium]
MKRVFKLAVVLGLMVGMSAGLYSNGLNLNSNGSKAIAMGGAFVGLADDYSAVHWNPAGLTQMKETSVSLFVTDIVPKGTYQFALAGVDAAAKSKNFFSGGVGYFKPLSENVVFGIYAYAPSGVGVEWEPNELSNLTGGVPYVYESYIGVVNVTPTIAFKLSPTVSLGIGVNVHYGFLEIQKPGAGQYFEDLDGFAVSGSVGLLFKPSKTFSFGVSYKTPIKATLKGHAEMSGAPVVGAIYGVNIPDMDDAQRPVTFPMWFGAGIALTPNEKLTFTADLQWTNWKSFGEDGEIHMEFANPLWVQFFQDAASIELDWKDTLQVRFGMEYKASDSFALRLGYYYDPDPAPASTMTIVLPEITYNFLTGGFGYKTEKMTFDFAVEYGIGKDQEVSLTEGLMPGIHGMNIFVATFSLTLNL